ncbi:MAG TPA: DsrE family protein [Candidatus Acidoferrum sp.]|nr:DsrE family protein [Candidatus Acidoferrum sp.]
MKSKKTLTFLLMDAPFENARTTTALRLIDIAARRGYDINVFAYEGAVYLPFAAQKQHANAVHGHDVVQEDHPLPREWVEAVVQEAAKNGGRVDWVNCGLCVDERGATDAVAGVRRGSPADFWKMATSSDNTLVIATK